MKKPIKKIELKKKTISFLNQAAVQQMNAGKKPAPWTDISMCQLCPSFDVPCDSQNVCDSINFC